MTVSGKDLQPDSTRRVDRRARGFNNKLKRWFFEGIRQKTHEAASHQDVWWKVMCLTGVDYFSSLGYQPGIAFLAAGILAPLATSFVVIMTIFGLVPVYFRVAKDSPFGQGSVSMLEHLLPGWKGKTLVLILLGFAATSFIITITLSAADATAHIVENPLFGGGLDRLTLTLSMVLVLGLLFLMGFREAIGVCVAIVALYMFCNAAVITVCMQELFKHPELMNNWTKNLFVQFHSIPQMIGLSLILFPKLALGMSGFETGVAVMPLVKGNPDDDPHQPKGRIRNTKKLLLAAAVIMAFLLLPSGIITTLLIPPHAFDEGQPANGRAVAYLAHQYLGEGFGTVYDISTILILWFAGASAIAGLLNLLPRYLPRYGMAPDWARAQRPLVLFLMVVACYVTIVFKADVDAQAGAYATGVLVLFTSASLAVAITCQKDRLFRKFGFYLILVVFVYTSVVNMYHRPEGLHIASFFILAILVTSLCSRAVRSLELRIEKVEFDNEAARFVEEAQSTTGGLCLLAHRPGGADYALKETEVRKLHKLTEDEASFVFLEVTLNDPSEFVGDRLVVTAQESEGGYRVLKCSSPAIPNAIAAVLLHIRDQSGKIPHVYFGWTEGNPLGYVFKYIFFGEGETAPIVREILREVEPNPNKRPVVIVG